MDGDGPNAHLVIGRVGRPHGLDGAFVVISPSDDPRRWEIGAEVLVDGVRAEVVGSHVAGGGRRIVKLDRRVARGTELAVCRSDLPPPEPGAWYAHDLIGLRVEDERGHPLGVVQGVYPGVANDNLELGDGTLVPLIDDAVREVDLDERRVVVVAGFLGDTLDLSSASGDERSGPSGTE